MTRAAIALLVLSNYFAERCDGQQGDGQDWQDGEESMDEDAEDIVSRIRNGTGKLFIRLDSTVSGRNIVKFHARRELFL